jgi:hypothetical protein
MDKIPQEEITSVNKILYPQTSEYISIESNLVGGPWESLRIVRNPNYLSNKAAIGNQELSTNQDNVDSVVEPVKPSDSKSIASAIEILIGLTVAAAAIGVIYSMNYEKTDTKKIPEPTYLSNPLTATPNFSLNKAQ